MTRPELVPLKDYREYPVDEMTDRASRFASDMQRRRSVRDFSDRPVPRTLIENCIRAGGTAPSGANKQPWHFVVVADAGKKKQIREAAESEEHEFYTRRAPPAWLEVLAPLGTSETKPFLEKAPYVIVVFEQRYGVGSDGEKLKHYYTQESVGIATGILITAFHNAGLVSLTHTPSPMGFLNEILGRPAHDRPYLILVVGYPAEGAMVPKIERKTLKEIMTFL